MFQNKVTGLIFGFGKKENDYIEKRQFPRHSVVRPGNIYVENRPVPCLIIDISQNGVRISTEVYHGLTGIFTFDFMDKGEVIKGEAEVVYGMTSYDSEVYGCKLVSVVPSDYLEKYVRR